MLLFCTLLTKDARERSPSWPLWLVATDLAARLMPQDIRKSRANPPKAPIGKFEHQSGKIDQTLERFAPGEAGGWSDSPQGVERIAPRATPSGQPSATPSALLAPPETPLGRTPCDALPSVRSRMPRTAHVSERGDGGTSSSRRRPARRGPWRRWRARARQPAFPCCRCHCRQLSFHK